MSKEAYDLMQRFANEKNIINEKYTKKRENQKKQSELKDSYNLDTKLHGEHLTPMSYTRSLLNRALVEYIKDHSLTEDELRKKIDYAFKDARICIISKEEQNDQKEILDGKGRKFSKEDVEAFLAEYKKVYPDLPSYVESDFREVIEKPSRDNGFGSLRLFVLMKNGVKFVDAKGEIKTFEECMAYLKDDNYSI